MTASHTSKMDLYREILVKFYNHRIFNRRLSLSAWLSLTNDC